MVVNNPSSVIRGPQSRNKRRPYVIQERRRSRSPSHQSTASYRSREDSEDGTKADAQSTGRALTAVELREKERLARLAKWDAIKAKHRPDVPASPAEDEEPEVVSSGPANGLHSRDGEGQKQPPLTIEKELSSSREQAERYQEVQLSQDGAGAQNGEPVQQQTYDDSQDLDKQVMIPGGDAKDAQDRGEADEEDDDFDMFAAEPVKEASKPVSARKLGNDAGAGLDEDADDTQGYLRYVPNELIAGRYQVLQNLGRGTFSHVARARDNITGQLVAIKIIRRNESMVKAAGKECQILETLAEADKQDVKHIVRLGSRFYHKGHFCIVFENLDMSLRNAIEKFGKRSGLSLQAVRTYARQILLALSLLKECKLVHADLKPDNMLLHESHRFMKVCDLGSAAYLHETEPAPELASRFYRSPELMLGAKPDCGVDMWSAGCTVFELATGSFLFTGANNNEMLRSIQETRGGIHYRVLARYDQFAMEHFLHRNKQVFFLSREVNRFGEHVIKEMEFNHALSGKDLRSRIMQSAGTPGKQKEEMGVLRDLADLLERMLTLDPNRRISPDTALEHAFFRN